MAKDLLFEIGTEEIPAKFMTSALSQLKEMAVQKLQESRISYAEVNVYGTPRRLTLYVKEVADAQQELVEEVRGPAKKVAFDNDDKPTKAAQGFARGQGVNVEELTLRETESGEYVYAFKKLEGKPTLVILPQMLLEMINGLNFPKPMRWAHYDMRFARPIRWLVALYGEDVVSIEISGVQSGRITRSHRFLGAGEFAINKPETYLEQLAENYVIVDQDARKKMVWEQIVDLAKKEDGLVESNEELLEEVTYLLEYPTALMGSFAEKYLQIPDEVVVTPMREHQRYFPVRNADGKLLNKFITVRNGLADHIDNVREGNEKVLQARLADADFFYQEDKKTKLEDNVEKLKKIVFQESLGTVYQKVERIINQVGKLADKLNIPEVKEDAQRAAFLAKADLVTNMVYEFPELQGIMGRYYALLADEKEEVGQAIFEHYLPRFAGDILPETKAGALISIADKLDTICGCFAIGIEPTGSQDPYALRRQALGICHIIIKHDFKISLLDILRLGLENYEGKLASEKLGENTLNKIMEFFQPRLKNILADIGHRYDVVDAVLATDFADIPAVIKRAEAVTTQKETDQFKELLQVYTRVNNLAKKAGNIEIKEELLVENVEKELYQALQDVMNELHSLYKREDFAKILLSFNKLVVPINEFFNGVMVMAEDEAVKNNRLAMLARIADGVRMVADLSKIVL